MSVFAPRRLGLWLLPIVLAVALAAATHLAGGELRLHRASELLVTGDAAGATDVLRGLEQLRPYARRARAGLVIAGALEDDGVDPALLAHFAGDLDSGPFDLPLLVRSAFARGDFDAALRLTELSRTLGQPSIPLVTLAARIEAGLEVRDAAQPEDVATPLPNVLASRVADHLKSPDEGLVLRSRSGHPLARLVDGELEPFGDVDPRLVPRALAGRASSVEAGSLHTSLDLDLSRAAAGAFGRFRGSIVLVDPWTGEVLAAVSDRRTHAREDGTPALEQMREPASISKLITTAAYLRAGHDPDARLARMACRGHASYAGERLYCPVIAGPLRGLDRAMAVSCNVAFAELATEIGRESMLSELRRFGFDGALGAFESGHVLAPRGDERQLADLAIGLDDTELTPLHAALLAAVVASGGEMPEPTLLRAADGRLGLHPRLLHEPKNRRVLEPDHAAVLRHSMVAVAERGTGRRMKTRGFPVAMKTGTASHPRHGFHVNYIGFGPLPETRVAFCVRITNQGTSRRVRAAAAEVTARLLRNLRTVARERGWSDPRPPGASPQRLARLSPTRQRVQAAGSAR